MNTIAEKSFSGEEFLTMGDAIAQLATDIDVATHRLLTHIGQFDQKGGWHTAGCLSCAHWLSWRIGMGLGPRCAAATHRATDDQPDSPHQPKTKRAASPSGCDPGSTAPEAKNCLMAVKTSALVGPVMVAGPAAINRPPEQSAVSLLLAFQEPAQHPESDIQFE